MTQLNNSSLNERCAFYLVTARRVLDQLAVTDTVPTPKTIRSVLKEEELGSYLSEPEIMGVIATAMNLSKQHSHPKEHTP